MAAERITASRAPSRRGAQIRCRLTDRACTPRRSAFWQHPRRSHTLAASRTWEEGDDPRHRRPGVSSDEEHARGSRRHDDPDGEDRRVGHPPPVPVRRRVRLAVPLHAEAVLVSVADLHGGVRLRRPRAAGGQLPRALRRPGSPRRLLRARLHPRVRPNRHGHRPRRRGRHGHHRGPGGAQDPRGARRPAGARRRPGQEPRRPPLPGPDAGHRAVRHLRPHLRRLRGHRRHAGQRLAPRALLGDLLHQRLDDGPLGVGPQVHPVRRDHRDRLLLQGHDRDGRSPGRRARRQPGRRDRDHGRVLVQLRVHADAAGHPSRDPQHQVTGWLAIPREWVASFGDIVKFCSRVVGEVFGLKVFRFFGEALRQAGLLILSSTLVIWGLIFIIGLQCGIEGAYFNRAVGSPAYAGVFAAWCDLRELVPYAFGYMMAAKVGTGIVAEIGSMRISDEVDALEVMGISSMTFLCATRLLAAWLVLPFMYLAGIGAGFFASYLAVVQQIGEVSSGGFFLVFWMFQNPPDLLYSVIKAMAMATVIVLVGCYYGYTASGGPVGVGTATAKSMVLNTVMVHLVGMVGTQIFWGSNPRAPIGG